MPRIFNIDSYVVYFWSNEGKPKEPLHVHIAEITPRANGTKIWITRSGKALLCNNQSKIPSKDLRKIIRIIEANSFWIAQKWYDYFGEIQYYC